MTIQSIKETLPEFAKDTRLNLSSVLTPEGSPGLSLEQIASTALACAYAKTDNRLIGAIQSDFKDSLSEESISAAKAAATLMAMNNVYYRFLHLAEDKSYGSMPARLRMNVIANPGVPKVDFELYSLAVSAMNGCGSCINAHISQLEKAGITKEGVQSGVRIAAVITATAAALQIVQSESNSVI